MAFARVASEWTHHDQTLPDELDAELSRRDVKPMVRGLSLDTDFAAVDPTVYVLSIWCLEVHADNGRSHGNVSFMFQGVSAPDLSRPSFFHPTHRSLLTRDVLDGFLNCEFSFCVLIRSLFSNTVQRHLSILQIPRHHPTSLTSIRWPIS